MLNVACRGVVLSIFREATCHHVLSRPSSLEASDSGSGGSSVVGFLKQTIKNLVWDQGWLLLLSGGAGWPRSFKAHSSAYCRYTTPLLIALVPCLMSLRKQRRKHTSLLRSSSSVARRTSCTTSWMIPSSNLIP